MAAAWAAAKSGATATLDTASGTPGLSTLARRWMAAVTAGTTAGTVVAAWCPNGNHARGSSHASNPAAPPSSHCAA